MTKPKMLYFSQEDILHLVISEGEEANSVEISPNITAELNEKGELIGIEILDASAFVRDAIMEGVQAFRTGGGDAGAPPQRQAP